MLLSTAGRKGSLRLWHRAEGTVRCHRPMHRPDPSLALSQLGRGVEEHREHPGRHRQHVRRPGRPAGCHAGVRGTRAPRTSGLTWAQGHNDPRPPPRPAALLLFVPFVQPSPPGHPLGVCTKKKIPQDCAHGLGSGRTPSEKQKNPRRNSFSSNTRRNKATRNGPHQLLGLQDGVGVSSLPTCPVATKPVPLLAPEPRVAVNVAQALPNVVALAVAGPGGQLHLGLFSPFFPSFLANFSSPPPLYFSLCHRWLGAGRARHGETHTGIEGGLLALGSPW